MDEKRKKIKYRRKSILKQYSFEILILFLIIAGIFLLVENIEIKSIIIHYLKITMKAGVQFFQFILNFFSRVIKIREGSDIIGMGLIFSAITLLYFHYRKMVLTEWNSGKNCSDCETKMVRKQKEQLHKIISKFLFVKVRHYFCKKCNSSKLYFR